MRDSQLGILQSGILDKCGIGALIRGNGEGDIRSTKGLRQDCRGTVGRVHDSRRLDGNGKGFCDGNLVDED